MKTYMVEETCIYEVDADSEEEAKQIIIDAEDRDKYFYECIERTSWERATS